ncbi:MAG: carbohydrate ABC transporter permease [Clostridiales bacterium]|nr:carbohydrate ABC transporter permease [Clostridiales bacterium]
MAANQNKIDRKKRSVLSILATALMILVAVFAMIPFAFMFMSSLKPGTEMMRYGLTLKFDPGISSFENYAALNTYREGVYWHWYKSSAIIMVLQTAIGLFFGSIVGYGLAMYDFKGKNLIFTLVLVVMMLPFEILLLPMYQMMIRAKLMNSYIGVVIPYLVPPFMIFFFRQYCLGIPKELMEAGRIDGCSDYGIFLRIMVPILIPAFGAMTILSCMNSWNNLLWPMIILQSEKMHTIPIGMGTTITPYGNAYDVLMPGAVMAVVPIIVIYLFCQKTFIAGMTAGSVKG